jgi:hypothetical protein
VGVHLIQRALELPHIMAGDVKLEGGTRSGICFRDFELHLV